MSRQTIVSIGILCTLLLIGAMVYAQYGQSPVREQKVDNSNLQNITENSPENESAAHAPPLIPDGVEHTITLGETGFEPNEIIIQKGDTVVFTTTKSDFYWPASNIHPTHSIYSEFDPKKPIAPDKNWSFRFTNLGTWKYHDHLRAFYTGTITVIE